jgi:hypothetical protein
MVFATRTGESYQDVPNVEGCPSAKATGQQRILAGYRVNQCGPARLGRLGVKGGIRAAAAYAGRRTLTAASICARGLGAGPGSATVTS